MDPWSKEWLFGGYTPLIWKAATPIKDKNQNIYLLIESLDLESRYSNKGNSSVTTHKQTKKPRFDIIYKYFDQRSKI